ncbi:hypothetical protein ABZU45_24520 [Streptomyces avermitilis]
MTSFARNSDHSGSAAQPPSCVCPRCGTTAEGPRPTWPCSVENGVRIYFCDSCARANLGAIEGRLDSAWW